MEVNYYDILGLNKNCSKDEIKKQYKKLALLYHPDKNREKDTSNKFQEITTAYEILYDESKRKNYDLYGIKEDISDPFETFNNIFNNHLHSFMNMNYENDLNINELLSNVMGNTSFDIPNVHFKFQTFQKGSNEDIIENVNSIDELKEKPDAIIIHIDVELKEIYKKEKKEIIFDRIRKKNNIYTNKSKKIKIDIFDEEIFLENIGHEKENCKLKGDVLININLNENKYFKRINDYDLLYIKDISLKDFYNDLEYELVLPDDNIIDISNEKFTLNGYNIQKLENYGIPYKENNEWFQGNLYIYYKIKYPHKDDLYDFVEEVYDEEIVIEKKDIISKNCSISEIL